jgi:CrcB protein
MGMESPETARLHISWADDSYRATWRWEFVSTPPQGGFFVALNEPSRGNDMGFLIVFLGGGIGAALRHGVNLAFARWSYLGFPLATLTENVTGSLAMGLLAAYFAFKGDASQHWRLFLTTGILGGYTTFSAFSLDTALLIERGQLGIAALYVALSVALSIGGLFAGLALMRQFA